MIMDGEKAVVAVIKELNTLALPLFTGRIFKYVRREKYTGEYIAVNHLPFVYGSEIGEGIININVHVPRLTTNEPDTGRLYDLWNPIKEHFFVSPTEESEGVYLEGAYFSFYSHSLPTPDDDGTYYVNVQLKVNFNNVK